MEIFKGKNINDLLENPDNKYVWDVVLSSLVKAMDENLPYINCFKMDDGESLVVFTIDKEFYGDFLENLMNYYIHTEQYEKCQLCKIYLEKLNIQIQLN